MLLYMLDEKTLSDAAMTNVGLNPSTLTPIVIAEKVRIEDPEDLGVS